MSGGGYVFLNHSNLEAVLNKRHLGILPEKQSKVISMSIPKLGVQKNPDQENIYNNK